MADHRSSSVLVTGFGAFEGVEENPSGLLARSLDGHQAGAGTLLGRELSVTFAGSARDLDAALALFPHPPSLVLATGVHPGDTFRLEQRATTALRPGRADSAGEMAQAAGLGEAPDLHTRFDLGRLEAALRRAGAQRTEISTDAGGYVCERVYRHVLEHTERSGVPGLFLHVPPLGVAGIELQRSVVLALLDEMLAALDLE